MVERQSLTEGRGFDFRQSFSRGKVVAQKKRFFDLVVTKFPESSAEIFDRKLGPNARRDYIHLVSDQDVSTLTGRPNRSFK